MPTEVLPVQRHHVLGLERAQQVEAGHPLHRITELGAAQGVDVRQGRPLIDLGVHALDFALFLLQEPTPVRVSASAAAFIRSTRSSASSVNTQIASAAGAGRSCFGAIR